MADKDDTGEPDDSPLPKRKAGGGKVVKAKGKRPQKRLDKMARGGNTDKWMQGAVKHKGALHRELGIPEGQKIPVKKLEKATHSSNPLLKKRAILAETFKKANKD